VWQGQSLRQGVRAVTAGVMHQIAMPLRCWMGWPQLQREARNLLTRQVPGSHTGRSGGARPKPRAGCRRRRLAASRESWRYTRLSHEPFYFCCQCHYTKHVLSRLLRSQRCVLQGSVLLLTGVLGCRLHSSGPTRLNRDAHWRENHCSLGSRRFVFSSNSLSCRISVHSSRRLIRTHWHRLLRRRYHCLSWRTMGVGAISKAAKAASHAGHSHTSFAHARLIT